MLDTHIWECISALLLDTRLFAYELESCRNEPTQTLAQVAVDAIDARLADLSRRMDNKRKRAELVDDAGEGADLPEVLTALRAQHRNLDAERSMRRELRSKRSPSSAFRIGRRP